MTVAERRLSSRERLLQLLSDGKVHSMQELLRVGGFRYGGRLFELRKQGHLIETIRLADDEFAYRLLPNQRTLI